jgi:hypothetical protein
MWVQVKREPEHQLQYRPWRWTANTFKNFLIIPLKAVPRPSIPSALVGEKLDLRRTTGTGKLSGPEGNWSAAWHENIKPAILLPPPCHRNKQGSSAACSLTGEAARYSQTVLCGDLRPATKFTIVGVKRSKFNLYCIVKGNFEKILAFRGAIRKFLNMVAKLFSCQCLILLYMYMCCGSRSTIFRKFGFRTMCFGSGCEINVCSGLWSKQKSQKDRVRDYFDHQILS